jgi:Fe-S cluster assembly ATP-binding protein
VEESYKTLLKTVGLDSHFHEAGVNTVSQPPEDWKKNEIVQLLMSRPTIGIVDQIDEDLDDETLDYIILMLKNYLKTNEKVSLIIISNNMKFLDQMEPHFVHVLVNGKIAETGDKELYKRIISDGNPQLS